MLSDAEFRKLLREGVDDSAEKKAQKRKDDSGSDSDWSAPKLRRSGRKVQTQSKKLEVLGWPSHKHIPEK